MSGSKGNARMKKIKHKKTILVIYFVFCFISCFVLLLVFGLLFGKIFDALQNNNYFVGTEKILSKNEFIQGCLMMSLQRILIYFLPSLIAFVVWLIFQKKNKIENGFKIDFRVYLFLTSVELFSYEVLSSVHYFTAFFYWSGLANPFSATENAIFVVGIFLSFIIDKRLLSNDDVYIDRLLFEDKKQKEL